MATFEIDIYDNREDFELDVDYNFIEGCPQTMWEPEVEDQIEINDIWLKHEGEYVLLSEKDIDEIPQKALEEIQQKCYDYHKYYYSEPDYD